MRKTTQKMTNREREEMFNLLDRLEGIVERQTVMPSVVAIEHQQMREAAMAPAPAMMLEQMPNAFYDFFEVEGR